MSDVHHETIYFSGHVQGVGFRYTTMQIAKEFEIAGFARNLPDGRVHIEAEGLAGEIQAFVAEIEERMHGFVRRTERTSDQRPRQFNGFTIR